MQKFQSVEFDGTTESFEKMAVHLDLCPYKRNYEFLDEKLDQCYRFTGIVKVNNVIYKKGDHYLIEING